MRKIRFNSLRLRLFTGIILLTMLTSWLPIGTFSAEAAPTQLADTDSAKITVEPAPVSEEAASSETRLSNIREQFAGKTGPVFVTIELQDEPAIQTYLRARQNKATSAIQIQSSVNQRNRIQQAQQNVEQLMASSGIKAQVFYHHKNTFNGLSARVDSADIEQIAKLPGVANIHLSSALTVDHQSSVALIGAPQYWTSLGITGQGMKIGIIDTGTDYIHTNLGGPGTASVYATNDSTVITEPNSAFPNSKVVGGYDFVGDVAESLIPVPDPDPFDSTNGVEGCEAGHGSHVSGTAAGYGVNANGTTYNGPYNSPLPANMKLYPGVAPAAKLYALRVIGCGGFDAAGFENALTQAIEWSTDPNDDGDFSDRLDVINMSLGMGGWGRGPYANPATIASDNASELGVIVVKSSGNLGRSYYSQRRPGSSIRAIVVANTVDANDYYEGFRVDDPADIRGIYPAGRSSSYAWANSPVISGNVFYPTSSVTGCAAFSPEDAAVISTTKPIVLLDWFPAGSNVSPCGSAARANRVTAAGGTGLILGFNQDIITIAIAGNAAIPAIITNLATANTLKSKLTPGVASNVHVTLVGDFGIATVSSPSQTDTIADSSSIGIGSANNLKPDIAAPGTSIFSTKLGSGTEGVSFNGTSMASPHVAGTMALLRQQYPDWSVEELKALLMNTAVDIYTGPNHSGDRQTPISIGAGRVNLAQAINNKVLAYNTDMPGNVSVSFGVREFVGFTQLTRTVRIVNKNSAPVSYNVSFDAYATVPGVTYTFPNGSLVNIPANGTVIIPVVLTANPAQMKSPLPPTIAPTQSNLARYFLPEASGMLVLAPTGGTPGQNLRVPVWSSPRPASAMKSAQNSLTVTSNALSTSLTLTGTGVANGNTTLGDVTSRVAAFELQASLVMTNSAESNKATLKHVGMASDARSKTPGNLADTVLYFGLTSHNDWLFPAYPEVMYQIYIDTNRDGTPDYILYNERAVASTDTFVSILEKIGGGGGAQYYLNNAEPVVGLPVFNSSSMVLAIDAASLEMTSTTRFDYWIEGHNEATGDVTGNTLTQRTPKLTYDWANPGVDMVNGGNLLWNDLPGQQIPVQVNEAGYYGNKSKGILLLHFNNLHNNQAEVVNLTINCSSPTNVVTLAENNSGQCGTLSRAILDSNAITTPQAHNISFNVPGNVITLTEALPALNSLALVTFDGACQAGKPTIQIKPAAGVTIPVGLSLLSANSSVKGLHFSGFKDWALNIQGSATTVQCSAFSGSGGGILLAAELLQLGVSGLPNSGNYIYGNSGYGILVKLGLNNLLSHNSIGYDLNGNRAKNMQGGIKVESGQLKMLVNNRTNSAS